MSELIFEINSTHQEKGKPSKASGNLRFNQKAFKVTSGGFGKGMLPYGTYVVKVHNVVDKNLGDGFKIGKTQFFIPIEIVGNSTRHGLGIHPDGNKPGTQGCIGVQGADAEKFWKSWCALPLKSRPMKLLVTTLGDFPKPRRDVMFA